LARPRLIAHVEVLLAVVFWGASFIATKVALREVSPITVVWVRFTIGLLVLGAAVVARRQFTRVGRHDLGYFAGLGFLGITFHQWLQSHGLLTARATTTAWLVTAIPVFMALLGWAVLKERLRREQVAGIGLAAVGVLVVVAGGDLASLWRGDFGTPGDVLILISALNWAVFSALSKRGLRRYPATLMTFDVMAFGCLYNTALLAAGPGLAELGHLSGNGWLALGFLGVACSGLAYIFWNDALQVIPAAELGVFLYVEPLVAVGVAAVVLGEAMTLLAYAGGAVILLGVWLVNRRAST
jgi:drug/metabolite transporter (DMT)-like permease